MSDTATISTPAAPAATPATSPAPTQAPGEAASQALGAAAAAAITGTEVAEPSAPTGKTVQNEPQGIEALINKLSRNVTPEALADVPLGGEAPTTETPTGETVGDAGGGTETAPPSALVGEIAYDDPEGQVVLRARDPQTGQFAQMDSQRVYELSIKDPGTGARKVYEKNLEGIMRLAQDGLNMQRARDELKYYRENVGTWQHGHQEQQSTIEQAKAATQQAQAESGQWRDLAISLLTESPDWVNDRRERYAQQFTPENENARLRQELAELRSGRQIPFERPAGDRTQPNAQDWQQQQQIQQHQQLVSGFTQRVSAVIAEVEGLVGKEAAAGHFALATAPLLVNGQIPPNRFHEVEQYVSGPFRQWAQAEAAKRTSAQTIQQQAQSELAKAREIQARAQQAARSVGTATRPNAVTSGTQAPQRPKPNNVRDMVDAIARRPSPAQGRLAG